MEQILISITPLDLKTKQHWLKIKFQPVLIKITLSYLANYLRKKDMLYRYNLGGQFNRSDINRILAEWKRLTKIPAPTNLGMASGLRYIAEFFFLKFRLTAKPQNQYAEG